MLSVAGCSGTIAEVPAVARLALESCTVPGIGAALCGSHEVAENRGNPSGRRISIHVLVLPALGNQERCEVRHLTHLERRGTARYGR